MAAGITVGLCTPLGEYLSDENLGKTAEALGYWGPVVILLAGILTPLLFLPRWPVAVAAGLLYGLIPGTLLANTASALGAWLQFSLANNLLSSTAERLRARYHWLQSTILQDQTFMIVFLLRLFPFSSYVATNLLSGMFNLRRTPFLLATFFGMIPSSVMYAVCGKLVSRPSTIYYIVAGIIVLLFIVSTYLARNRLLPMLKKTKATDETLPKQS